MEEEEEEGLLLRGSWGGEGHNKWQRRTEPKKLRIELKSCERIVCVPVVLKMNGLISDRLLVACFQLQKKNKIKMYKNKIRFHVFTIEWKINLQIEGCAGCVVTWRSWIWPDACLHPRCVSLATQLWAAAIHTHNVNWIKNYNLTFCKRRCGGWSDENKTSLFQLSTILADLCVFSARRRRGDTSLCLRFAASLSSPCRDGHSMAMQPVASSAINVSLFKASWGGKPDLLDFTLFISFLYPRRRHRRKSKSRFCP